MQHRNIDRNAVCAEHLAGEDHHVLKDLLLLMDDGAVAALLLPSYHRLQAAAASCRAMEDLSFRYKVSRQGSVQSHHMRPACPLCSLQPAPAHSRQQGQAKG